jgi:hypothetical protein
MHPGLDLAVAFAYAREARAHQVFGADLAGRNALRRLGRGEMIEFGHGELSLILLSHAPRV